MSTLTISRHNEIETQSNAEAMKYHILYTTMQ